MTGCPLVMVSGWAHGRESLGPLARSLEGSFKPQVLSLSDLEDDYAAHLCSTLEVHPEPCLLMGWSMGGMVALEAAARHPERVRGLILLASTSRFCAAEGYPHGVQARNVRGMSAALERDPARVLDEFYRRAASPARKVLAGGRLAPPEAEGRVPELRAGLRYLLNTDLRPLLGGLDLPTLLVHGHDDVVVPWGASAFAAARIRRSRAVFWRRTGHDLPMRWPDLVANDIVNFSEGLDWQGKDTPHQ